LGGEANDFEYRGWLVHLEVRAEGSLFTGDADLSRGGKQVRRVHLPMPCRNEISARWALDCLACDLIDDESFRPTPSWEEPEEPE
jgi:hypothetical protein